MSLPDFSGYLQNIARYFRDDMSSEMSYRTDFQNMLEQIFPKEEHYHIQHDPRATAGNKPDFIISRHMVPLLYIEVKKVGENLDKIERSDQASRYFGYTNLIISDYLEFRFYRNGQRYNDPISLGTPNLKTKEMVFHPEQAAYLARTIHDFTTSQKEPIKSGKHLAKIMGGKAQRIRENVIALLETDRPASEDLKKIMMVIQEHLVSDLDLPKFADLYAQTLVYGLFVARHNDPTPKDFSRQEARDLVPRTNPFLQHFFDHIVGPHFPKRLDILVAELCEVFSHADVHQLMDEYFQQRSLFGDSEEKPDPVIHFYEDFLREYDPSKKMEMGVFYTPRSVVHFILRSVDALLKKEFGIARGLADNQKLWQEVEDFDPVKKKPIKRKKEFHKVQILDIATGTGTFLNETIQFIAKQFEGREGVWQPYVEADLIPRLLGFELMMAPYTIAHLKLGMTLEKTGVKELKERLKIYLTNTLDEAKDGMGQQSLFGFLESIAEESHSASKIKKEYPIMAVIGNPPYSGISQNKHYTENNAYKVEPGGKQKLQERKHWLDDDYVKFIRFAESLIEKNGEGIVGMITAHGYIDNPTFRGMRWHLRKTFDKIYVLDLHGNSNKKETTPEGEKDENVFDIKTGVSILLGVKKSSPPDKGDLGGSGTNRKKPLATVYHADFFGLRKEKQVKLDENDVESVEWEELPEDCEIWREEEEGKEEYEKGVSVKEMFSVFGLPMMTGRDRFTVYDKKEDVEKLLNDINFMNEDEIRLKYDTGKDTSNWDLKNALKEVRSDKTAFSKIIEFDYRLFDSKFTYYTGSSSGFHSRPQNRVNGNMLKENLALLIPRQLAANDFYHVFVTQKVADFCVTTNRTKEANNLFPLYLYFDDGSKEPNLDMKIVQRFEKELGLSFTPQPPLQGGRDEVFSPENILDYVYAVLHSPSYREKYKAFLKTDFPRVPYPSDLSPLKKGEMSEGQRGFGGRKIFEKLVPLGTKLRNLHLLEDPVVKNPITTFPIAGDNIVEKLKYEDEKVYFNAQQFFGNVPENVWNFYIGGYQPAQKFLKDRKGKTLSHADIERYEEMIVSLSETIKVMEEIDGVLEF